MQCPECQQAMTIKRRQTIQNKARDVSYERLIYVCTQDDIWMLSEDIYTCDPPPRQANPLLRGNSS